MCAIGQTTEDRDDKKGADIAIDAINVSVAHIAGLGRVREILHSVGRKVRTTCGR